MSRARRVAKWGFIGCAGLLATVAVALALGYGWLQSDTGRSWLARQIEDAASTPGEAELSIGSLTGNLPHRLRAENITLRDREGTWLSIAALELDWHPWALLNRTLDVERLELTGVAMPRLPAASGREEAESDSAPGDLFDFPLKVRVRRVAADVIDLGEPVLGQAARLTLEGEARRREDGSLTTALNLRRIDDFDGRLAARLIYQPGDDSLTADIEAYSAPGGLLATLLDTPDLPGATAGLKGSGALTDWAGAFTLSLGDIARADATIGLRRADGRSLAFSLQGDGTLDPPQRGVWRLIAGRTEVDLQGAWQDNRRLHLDHLIAANDTLRLSLSGDLEPDAGTLNLKLAASSDNAQAIAELADLDGLRSLAADVTVTGTLNRPQASLQLRGEGLATPDISAETITAGGTVAAGRDLLGPRPLLALDLRGEVVALRLADQDQVNQVLGDRLPFSLAGNLDLGGNVLEIAALEASAGTASVTAQGPLNLDDGSGTLNAQARVSDLAALQPLTEIRLGGAAQLAGPLTVQDFGTRIAAELTGRWDQPASEIGVITAVAGKGLDLAAKLTIEGSTVHVEQLSATSPATQITASLTVEGPQLRDGRYSVTLADAKVLAGEFGVPLSGKAIAEGTLAGPFDSLQLDGRAQLARLTVAEQALSDIAAGYKLRIAGADIDGPVEVALASPFGRAEAKADLQLRSDAVTLANLSARLPETTVAGSVIVPLDGGEPRADLQGELGDLGPWLAFAGFSGGGAGSLSVQLNQPGAAAPLTASAEFSSVQFRPAAGAIPLRAAKLTAKVTAQDPAFEQPGRITVVAEGFQRDDLNLDRVDLAAQGTATALDVELDTKGRWVEPIELSAAARIDRQDETTTVALRSAEGRAFGQPLQLKQTATLTLTPTLTRLEGLSLASGETTLTADARMGDGQVSIEAVLDALPMSTVDAVWESGLAGRVSAQVNLQGSFEAPSGTASLTATGLRPRDAKDLPELKLTAAADWQGGRLKADGELGGAQVTAARFSADAPLQLAPDGSVVVPEDAPLSGNLTWNGDIRTLLLFVPLPQHRLGGAANIDIALSGTPGAPTAQGRVELENGRYENLEQGTILKDLTLTAQVTERGIALTKLSGNDGAGGTISGKGGFEIEPDEDFPFDLSVSLDKFHALRRDDVTAVTSGTARLTGDIGAPRVEGRFTTDTIEVSLQNDLPPNVVSLDVVEIKDGVVQQEPQEEEAAPPVDAELDIVIDMPRRIFVRGRGLDSEWSGRITVEGTTAEPIVNGEVNLIRGRMDVIGKPFILQEGKVILPQGAETDPTLNVVAVHKGQDLTVTARLAGPLSDPELELSSVPQVPRDEIISRVLFNKSASELSAAEAAQLAIALRDLTGNGGGSDILGFARRTLGVDVLRVETSETGSAAVEAGKYLTDEVYLGVKQGADSQSSSAGVEVEITPNITVESEVTGSGASKSGVRFKWDY